MAENKMSTGADVISVAVTTQGSEASINLLNQSLQNMGGLLARVNEQLSENEQRLLNISRNASRIANTIGVQSRIASTALRNKSISAMGDAGVLLRQEAFEAQQNRLFARTLRDQLQNRATELLKTDKGGFSEVMKMFRAGDISSKDLKLVAEAQKALAITQGNNALLRRSNATLKAIEKADAAVLQEKENQKQLAKEATRLKIEANREAIRLKREQTARSRLAAMQEKENLDLLSTERGQLLAQANARRMTRNRAGNGLRQEQIESFIAENQGKLVGPNRTKYYSDVDYTKNGGALEVKRLLDQAKLHDAALGQLKVNSKMSAAQVAQIDNVQRTLAVEMGALMATLRQLTGAAFGASATAASLNQARITQKATSKLQGLDLSSAKSLSTLNISGVPEERRLETKLALTRAISDAQKALNYARDAGDTKAQKAAQDLNTKLHQQREALAALTGENKKRLEAQVRENEKFKNLSNESFRTNSIESQIKGAKTLLDLERLKRDELNNQFKLAKELEALAKKRGDSATEERAKKLVDQYAAEQALLKARRSEITNQNKPATNFQDRMSMESQGAAFLSRMMFIKDYMMMGGIMGLASGAYNFMRDFEAALKQTQAIAQGTEEQMRGLRKSIIDVSDSSRFSAIELTEATTVLAQAGFSVSEIQKSLSAVATLATATGSSLKDSVDIATSVMGAFKMSAESMPQVVNQITQAMNLSKLDVPKFMLATQYAGNAASDLGVTFREMLSATAAVSNSGIRSGSTMGTGMRQLLADLTTPTDKMKKKLLDLGLTFEDVDVRVNGLTGVMKNLKEAGFSTADAFDSFELRAAAYYVALSNNLTAYDDLYASMDNNTAAMRAQEIQMNSLAAQTDRMTNQFRIAADILGGDIRTALTSTTRFVADMTEAFNTAADESVVGLVLKIGVLTVALVAAVLVMKNATTVMRGMIAIFNANAAAAGAATLAGRGMLSVFGLPFTKVILAAAAAVSLMTLAMKLAKSEQEKLYEAYDRADTSLKTVQERVSGYRSAVSEVTEKIKSLSARSESLSNNQAELAVEFDIVRKKAIELGIDLKTKVESSVESLKESWAELRKELNQKILLDLELQQGSLAMRQLTERQLYDSQRKNISGFSSSNETSTQYRVMNSQGQIERLGKLQTPIGSSALGTVALDETIQGKSRGDILSLLSGNSKSANRLSLLTQNLSNPAFENDPKVLEAQRAAVTELYRMINADVRQAIINQQNLVIANPNNPELRKAAEQNAQMLTKDFLDYEKNPQSLAAYFRRYEDIVNQKLESQRLKRDTARAQASTLDNNQLLQRSGAFMGTSELAALGAKHNADPVRLRRALELQGKYKAEIEAASKKYNIPVELITALMTAESNGNVRAISPAGAVGLMQILPSTAKEMGYSGDLFDPATNIDAGTRYLSEQYKRFASYPMALAAYNAGPNNRAVASGRIPQNGETPVHNQRVMSVFSALRSGQAGSTSRDVIRVAEANPQLQALTAERNTLLVARDSYTQALQDAGLTSDRRDELKGGLDETSARISDLEEKMAALLNSAKTNAISQRDKDILSYSLELLKVEGEIAKKRAEVTELKIEDEASLKRMIEAEKQIYDLSVQQANIELDRKTLESSDTLTGSANLAVSQQQRRINDQEYQNKIQRFEFDRQKRMADATEKYNELVKRKAQERFDLALKLIEQENTEISKAYERRLKAFEDHQTRMAKLAARDVDFLRAARGKMDSPSNQGRFTAQEKAIMDREIARREEYLNQGLQESQLSAQLAQNKNLMESETAQLANQVKQLDEMRNKINTEMTLMSQEERKANEAKLTTLEEAILAQQEKIASLASSSSELQDKLDLIRSPNAGQLSFRTQLQDKYQQRWESMNTREGIYADLETSVDSISSGFSGLTDNLIEATGSVEDFFRAFIGRSKEGKEAWREFGMGILRTMMKVMTDRITAQFMNFLLGDVGDKKGGIGSTASGGFNLLGAGLNAVFSWFGGSFGAGNMASAVGNAPLIDSVKPAVGSVMFASEGGPVVGGKVNRDSVPVMAMSGEYILPKHTSSFLGDGFLEGLRTKPEATMKKVVGAGAAVGSKPVSQNVSVFVVSPDQVPSGLSKDDVVVTIADDINRNGPIKQLIKQVRNNA